LAESFCSNAQSGSAGESARCRNPCPYNSLISAQPKEIPCGYVESGARVQGSIHGIIARRGIYFLYGASQAHSSQSIPAGIGFLAARLIPTQKRNSLGFGYPPFRVHI